MTEADIGAAPESGFGMVEIDVPASMEALGLNPGSLADAEVYDGYLMAVEDEQVNLELARMDAVEIGWLGPPPAPRVRLLPVPVPVARVAPGRRSPRSRRSSPRRTPARPRPRCSRRAAA